MTGNSTTAVNGTQTDSAGTAAAASPTAARDKLVTQYRAAIPFDPGQLSVSNRQVEAALYELGGIYKEQLREREKGFETYERQVSRYARGEHAPDAYYLLYLYYRDKPDAAKTAQYAAALQREFPQSIYAKLVADPLYREHELALHNAVASRVDSAFTYYVNQEFRKANAVLARTGKQYPKSDLNDRVAYLKTLLVARTQPPVAARASVETFIKAYPDSPLQPQAQALAASYGKQESGALAGALASTEKPVISQFRPGEVNNRIRVFYKESESPAKALGPAPAGNAPKVPAGTGSESKAPAGNPVETAPSGSAGPEPLAPAKTGTPVAGAPPATASAAPATAVPVRKGRPTRKQLADDAAAKKAATTAAPAAAPTGALPTNAGNSPATPVPAPTAPAAPTAATGAPATAAAGTAPVRKGRPTRKQLADEAATKAAATKAAAATGAAPVAIGAAPGTTMPTATPAAAPGTAPTAGASTASSAPATAYTTQLNSPHAVVLVFAKGSPAATGLAAQLGTYNSRFFKANNLTVESLALGTDQELVVVKALPWAKVAQSYATKLRGPQSPLAKLRGAGYQTLVISPENLALLQSSGDLAGYLSFYQQAYK